MSLASLVILIVIVGIVLIVLHNSNIPIPGWFWQILGLVALAIVAIWAIRYVGGL